MLEDLDWGGHSLFPVLRQELLSCSIIIEIEIRGTNACVCGSKSNSGTPDGATLIAARCDGNHLPFTSRDLAAVTREADLLIVAIGRAGMIDRDYIQTRGDGC